MRIEQNKKVVVFGGSGFIGRNLRTEKPNWLYPKNIDATNKAQVHSYLCRHKPDFVVNLAANVGGIKYNTDAPSRKMMHDNYLMMVNVMESCDTLYIPSLTMSSTCVWPKKDSDAYPLGPDDWLDGMPEGSNKYYAYGKRMGMIISEDYSLSEIMVLSNVYGPRDHFFSPDSHFIPSIISKIYLNEEENLELWGVPETLRQMVYVYDVVDAIIYKVRNASADRPNISYMLGNNEKIGDIVERISDLMKRYFDKNQNIGYNGKYTGIPRKDVQVENPHNKWLDINEMTDIKQGLLNTVIWFKHNEIEVEEKNK